MSSENLFNPLKIIMLLMFATFLASCGGDGGSTINTNTATDTLSSLFERELKGCALNCHSPGGSEENGPNMSTKETFRTSLVNKNSLDYLSPLWIKGSTCSLALSFIKPGDAAQSMLLATFVQAQSDILAAATNCITSYNVHVANRVSLSATGIVDLTSWINKGALNN
ncbi:MAG: hypothetical protein Q9O24_09165 [Gammaproteobacteria bacterium]|nr:hypothetical protein [Gammaproteobacteria bacterium]